MSEFVVSLLFWVILLCLGEFFDVCKLYFEELMINVWCVYVLIWILL